MCICIQDATFAGTECSAAFGRMTKKFFKICATFDESKVTGGHNFIIFMWQRFLLLLLPEMYPKSHPHFSHTHLTEPAFSGILSVSQGRRAEKPAFFRLFCIYGEDNLWQP